MEVIDVVIMIEIGRGIGVRLHVVVVIGMSGTGTMGDTRGMRGIVGGDLDGIIVISVLLLQRSRDGIWSSGSECINSEEVWRGRRRYVRYVR